MIRKYEKHNIFTLMMNLRRYIHTASLVISKNQQENELITFEDVVGT